MLNTIDDPRSWNQLGRTPLTVRLEQQMLEAVQPELEQRFGNAAFDRRRGVNVGWDEAPSPEATLFATDDAELRRCAAELETRLRARPAPASPDEKLRLLAEQGQLASKRFSDEGLSPAEARRLAYVRWQIDRIEEAEEAASPGPLDRRARLRADVTEQVAAFRAEVDELATRFQSGRPGRPPGRGPRRRRAK